MSKKSCSRGPLDKWYGKLAETLLKSEWQHLYHIYLCLWKEFRLKKSLWVICKILPLFVNQLTADNKSSLLNWRNLLEDFWMQLSEKRKNVLIFFFTFFIFRLNFGHFQKEVDPHSLCVFELTKFEKRG